MPYPHGVIRERHLYVIRNSRIDPDWSEVERQTLSIAGRAVMSLIHTQGLGDLYRIYATTQRDGVDYNLAYIHTEGFPCTASRAFRPRIHAQALRHRVSAGGPGVPMGQDATLACSMIE